jgi:hypothetical protein
MYVDVSAVIPVTRWPAGQRTMNGRPPPPPTGAVSLSP